MKKRLILSVILLTSFLSYGQTSLYENPQFDQIAADHKVIAILPFNASVKLRPKQMKELSKSDIEKLEESEGYSIQRSMYSWFLKRKGRGTLAINIQDISLTNSILSKQSISIDQFSKYFPADLAQILNVDVVIMGDLNTNKPMSEGASVALGLLVGFWGTTNTAIVNMFIYNGSDGQLLINYHKKVRGSLGSTPDDLVNIIMRKASRRIAYTKKQLKVSRY